jgi:cysteine-rich repeat protein
MRWLAVLGLCLALGGCVDSELVECADDRLCPRGTACDVAHHSCVAPDQLTACNGLPDLTSCTATGVEMGRCFDGVCLPSGCGNGFTEPEELCDDGNTVGGDLCAADCRSREVCGDGFADQLRGEECDDGNTNGRDGCTNLCTLERPIWRTRLADKPVLRSDAAAAYDSLAGHVVMFGGLDKDGALLDDTWAVDEFGWTKLATSTPMRRTAAAIAYDSLRQRVVMFGGLSTTTVDVLLDDTWEWNGAAWVRRSSVNVPSARKGAAFAFDGTRTIMFGGSQLSDRLQDMWAWDGIAWKRLSPAHSPPAREKHAMAFDPKHNRIVMFGGKAVTLANDTWLFDGTDWKQLTTTPSPPAMSWAAFAYDAKRERLVLSGVDSTTNTNVVWELDGSTWQQMTTKITPAISGGAVFVYDDRTQLVVQHGGTKLATNQPSNEVWTWDGADWSQRAQAVLPAARHQCTLASDPVRGRVVLFGGQGTSMSLGTTFEWDGRSWQPRVAFEPAARVSAASAFDGNEVMLFGGVSTSLLADTWRWNGQRWQSLPVLGPSARYAHTMTYDSKRQRVVLFGGTDGSNFFADTWQWDGSTWSELPTPTAPSPRAFAPLAYDPERDRVVMFGGAGADGTKLTDTWELDGSTWIQQTPTNQPEQRLDFGLVYDRMRKRVMLFGGLVASFSLWEWDGTTWSQPDTNVVPLVMRGGCATYDDARGEIIAFGGLVLGPQQQTATGSYRGEREEVCRAGADIDEDGATGCDDDDCRMVCAPLCWDTAMCTQAPRCGDGACSTLESEAGAACPADCPL